jgi:hypothetical protein
VSGTDNREVATIQRCNGTDAKSLGKGHHGRIDGPEREVGIPSYELRDPDPIASQYRLGKKVSGSEVTKESHFRSPAQARFDEIDDFRDNELRHDQGTGMRLQ